MAAVTSQIESYVKWQCIETVNAHKASTPKLHENNDSGGETVDCIHTFVKTSTWHNHLAKGQAILEQEKEI